MRRSRGLSPRQQQNHQQLHALASHSHSSDPNASSSSMPPPHDTPSALDNMVQREHEAWHATRLDCHREQSAISQSSSRARQLLESFSSDAFPAWADHHRFGRNGNAAAAAASASSSSSVNMSPRRGRATPREHRVAGQAEVGVAAAAIARHGETKAAGGGGGGGGRGEEREEEAAEPPLAEPPFSTLSPRKSPRNSSKATKLALKEAIKKTMKTAGQLSSLLKSGMKRAIKTLVLYDDDLGLDTINDMVAWINERMDSTCRERWGTGNGWAYGLMSAG